MKRTLTLFLCAVLCLSLIGCSARERTVPEETATLAADTTATVTAPETETTTAPSDTTEGETARDTTTAGEPTSGGTTAAKTTAATTAKQNTTTQKSTPAQPTEASNKAPDTVTCTISIECTEILSHLDKLKEGHEAYVPPNGVMLSTTTVTLEEGATAYDLLKTVCAQNGITINTKSTGYGVYIAGLNGIDEKDCGKNSGWLYSIDGTYPMMACSKAVLRDGNSVIFRYTCGS